MILRILAFLAAFYFAKAEVFSESPDIIGTKGMVIDAGSGGSRLHIYSWKKRVFSTIPPPITIPEANELWTGKMAPGIDSLSNTPELVANYLSPLIDFAKVTLAGYENEFKNYPIYFKATGGMRELDVQQRETILRYVRAYLADKTQCPFYFRADFARVISGEEEAIFSWAATNFLMGTLLPDSQGLGAVNGVNKTYGTLDLGGASTQIAFYVPSQDINEGLYNLQIGSQKHWNVYTKSFLQFGVVSARVRHMQEVANKVVAQQQLDVQSRQTGRIVVPTMAPTVAGSGRPLSAVDPCFHSGYTEATQDSAGDHTVEVSGPASPQKNQLEQCMKSVKDLMELKFGKFCNEVFHGDCSIAGAYQPPIPDAQQNHFIGQSSYNYPWKFFMLPQTASLELFKERAENICAMNFGDVLYYFESNNLAADPDKLNTYLPYYCFLSSYILVLLQDGYRMPLNQTLTVLDEVNGHKVGWALGAILYEINELPWVLQLSTLETYPFGFVVTGSVLGFAIGFVAAVFMYKQFVLGPAKKDGGLSVDYDVERIKRSPTVEMTNYQDPLPPPISTSGHVRRHSRGTPPDSPGTSLNRKATAGVTSGSVAYTSPYASPNKAPAPQRESVFGGLNPFQQSSHRYEPVPDR